LNSLSITEGHEENQRDFLEWILVARAEASATGAAVLKLEYEAGSSGTTDLDLTGSPRYCI